jgi:assimilatory nitrate reductase catalytic subunit
VGCGLVAAEDVLAGDSAHPANFGRLCSKGAALEDTLSVTDRLMHPTVRGRETSWDEALGLVAREFLRIRDAHGPDAIAFYVSGQLLTEDYYVANKLMKGFIGAANIDTNSRLCMSSSVAGHVRAFGEDIVPGCYEDLEEADLVVQVGSNMAWCHPVLYQRLMATRERRNTQIVAIDPRRTATADTADLHLPIVPGSDVAVFNGLLAHLADSGALDHDWMDRHVSGFAETLAMARSVAPSVATAASAAGVPADQLVRFYDLFAQTERTVTLYSQGVNQSAGGTDKVNAIINCHLATGRIGRAGMGPFSLTGQPNAMGGREVGGLANQLAAHMGFTSEAVDCVRRFWRAASVAQTAGLKAVDLFDAAAEGRVKAIWIAATNPAASMPRAGHVRDALANCELVVVSDAWPTDTTKLAHVVLPAAAWSEKDGTVTNSERCISRQRAFRLAPGDARPDWWMFAEVARRMGWADAFGYTGPADIFREHAALSSFENDGTRLFDIGALATIDDRGYAELSPQQWPCPKHGGQRATRLFAHGGFPTPDRRARMVPVGPTAPAREMDYPLTLNTGRVRDQWHTMTRTGRVPRLMTHTPAPRLALNPEDAGVLGLRDGALVHVGSKDGSIVLRMTLDQSLRRGDAFAPMHWTDQFCSSGPIERLVHALCDPISGQPDLKATKVRVAAVTECWQGLLLRPPGSAFATPDAVYWSRVPLASGEAFELAGWAELPAFIDSEEALRQLLGVSEAVELVSYSDARRNAYRYAAIGDGRLTACVFFAQPGEALPDRTEIARRLGQPLSPAARFGLLAGVTTTEPTSRGRLVCSCFGVDETLITTTIRAKGLRTAEQVGSAIQAGTNCGSCVAELKRLLADCAPALPEMA